MRLLLLALLIYLGYVFCRAFFRALPGRRPGPPPAKTRGGEEMVRDPRCGTFVPRGDALTKTVGGKTHYFCSRECRDAYDGE